MEMNYELIVLLENGDVITDQYYSLQGVLKRAGQVKVYAKWKHMFIVNYKKRKVWKHEKNHPHV